MPYDYERMVEKFIEDGLDERDAKSKAASIHNSRHPEDPVTRNYDKDKKKEPAKLFFDQKWNYLLKLLIKQRCYMMTIKDERENKNYKSARDIDIGTTFYGNIQGVEALYLRGADTIIKLHDPNIIYNLKNQDINVSLYQEVDVVLIIKDK